MNRNTVLCAVAALMLPSVVHAHPLPTGGHGRASLACRPPAPPRPRGHAGGCDGGVATGPGLTGCQALKSGHSGRA
jgi:hypothetical protein